MTGRADTGHEVSTSFSFHVRSELFAGLHALDHLPLELQRVQCPSPFVIYRDDREGRHLYKLLRRCMKQTKLRGFIGMCIDGSHEGFEELMEMCKLFVSSECTGIIALGGGSLQAWAKFLNAAASSFSASPDAQPPADFSELAEYTCTEHHRFYPLFSVLTDHLDGREAAGTAELYGCCLSHAALVPSRIFLDSRGYPQGSITHTARTALFALAQFLEAVRPSRTSPLIEMYVRSGLLSLHHGIMHMQSQEGRHASACAAVYASMIQPNILPGPLTSLAALCSSSGLASQAEVVHALLPDMLELIKSRHGAA